MSMMLIIPLGQLQHVQPHSPLTPSSGSAPLYQFNFSVLVQIFRLLLAHFDMYPPGLASIFIQSQLKLLVHFDNGSSVSASKPV